jgi:DNA modification methylase
MGQRMKLETWLTANLTADPQNARTHDKRNLDAIATSLTKFGQRKPIVITPEGIILAGNGTVQAAKQLKWKELQVTITPKEWDYATARAYALADNRSAELAEWDTSVLASQLVELDAEGWDIGELGFDVPESTESLVEDEGPLTFDETEPITKLGDLYKLGNHRLLCGDSTDPATVAKLMDNKTADLVFTDPPYGVSYQSNFRQKSKKFDVLPNDDVVLDIAPVISANSNGWVFVWTSWKVLDKWLEQLSSFGYPTNIIVWDKGGGYIGDLEKTFGSDYEIALVWHNGKSLTGKRIGSVWDVGKDKSSDYSHPTQKPVGLAAMAIQHTTSQGNLVLDLFGGSGSTLIAAEQLNRTAYVMELDLKYCDVIVKRWEALTGKKAELVKA